MNEEKFDQWCIVEIMGHVRIAGKCSEQNIAGSNLLRVDVPETDSQPAFTRFYGGSSIYAIHPVTEYLARDMAKRFEHKPLQVYEIRDMVDKLQKKIESASFDDIDPF